MRIYLVRHGETVLNQKGAYYGRTDVPLSLKGREQAKMLGEFFRHISLRHIAVSPLCRAVETADIIMAEYAKELEKEKKTENIRAIDFYKEERLSEQNFGIFEGCTFKELTEKYPEEYARWNENYFHYKIPAGEAVMDVRRRTESLFADLQKLSMKADREECFLLVAHKGTLGHLLAVSLGLPVDSFWNFVIEQGCYSRIDLEDGYAIIRKLNQSVDR